MTKSGPKGRNERMLSNPMLYLSSIISSFVFAFAESYIGLFNFHLALREVAEIIILSVVGIFASMAIFGGLQDAERDAQKETRRRRK